MSLLNWCPGGCCHITSIFRCPSNPRRWYAVFWQCDFFFFKFCLFRGRETCCRLWQLDKKRLQSHFSLSIFYLANVMNKQHFRWLTSRNHPDRMLSCQAPVRILQVREQLIFSCDFLYLIDSLLFKLYLSVFLLGYV